MNLRNHSTLPFENTYWVIPGKVMAGEYPGRREEMETRRRIQSIIQSGIRVCIDLTKPGELTPSYREIFLEELVSYGYIGNYFHFPVYDFGIPSDAQMQRTLDVIDQCLEDETPVYIHCHAGIGRTGLTEWVASWFAMGWVVTMPWLKSSAYARMLPTNGCKALKLTNR